MKKLLLIPFIISLISCDNPVEPEYQHTHIVGVVTDRAEGFPLDSAIVFLFKNDTHYDGQNFWTKTIRLKEVIANEQGLYSIDCSVLGSDKYTEMYWIGAEKKGYSKTTAYTGKLVGRGRIQRIDISLWKY